MLADTTFADEAFNLWQQIWAAATQSQLFWISGLIGLLLLTPNKRYAQVYEFGKKWIQKFIEVDPKPPTPTPPVVIPTPDIPDVTIDLAKVTTAEDVSKIYHEFRKRKAARITELESMLTKERQELVNLDQLIATQIKVEEVAA